jgi:Tfp pilus assembly protein PilF
VRSAEEIIAGLLSSEAPEDPVGMALCLLTIDVQRVSGDAVDERILRHLLPRYLGSDVDDVVFRGGLAWAARPVLGTEGSLLRQTTRPDGAQVWEAHPAAIAADARTGRPVQEAVVQLLVDQLTALRLAVESDDPRLAAEAAVRLGDLLGKLGDQADARWAYERAVDSGHEEHAPMAAYLLGLHLEIEGDHAGAYRAYRVAALAPATPFGPQAAMNLGNLAFRNGERRLAEEGWRLAAESDHPEHAPAGAFNLGGLLQEAGDLDGARRAYEQAAASGRELSSSRAAFKLGCLLERLGDEEGAMAAFQQARSWPESEVFRAACYKLGILRWKRDEKKAAQSLFEDAVRAGDDSVIAPAEVAMGRLLLASGRHDAAADAFVRAIDATPRDDDDLLRDVTPRLAMLLQAHREQYPRILHDASERAAAYATIGLAYTLELHEDVEAAKQACELAVASGRNQPARNAAHVLGRLLRVYEDIPNAKAAMARLRAPDGDQEEPWESD